MNGLSYSRLKQMEGTFLVGCDEPVASSQVLQKFLVELRGQVQWDGIFALDDCAIFDLNICDLSFQRDPLFRLYRH